jgi:hypothetical protein
MHHLSRENIEENCNVYLSLHLRAKFATNHRIHANGGFDTGYWEGSRERTGLYWTFVKKKEQKNLKFWKIRNFLTPVISQRGFYVFTAIS